MKFIKALALLAAALSISACEIGPDKSNDFGPIDPSGDLSNMVAGIWVDPEGCDHWIIDDGVEGYLSERLTPDGRPVCSGIAPPSTAAEPFQETAGFPDLL